MRGDDLRVVLAPHAPHTTSAELMRLLGEHAAGRDEPLALHVAESPVEVELLATGDGPWRGLLDERGRPRLYADIAHPINQSARDFFQGRVLDAYQLEIDRSKQEGYVEVSFDDLDYEYLSEAETLS